ncbi:MAG: Unknown protein [uncultured Sulfurovum sp.]|uniref:Fucosyltransferase C-terminal domain-containing protein n=1 Tax=uncultured Sulfurovum sp. TaxID=269237 RepID=A0A6S6TV71_9BACT|nr:MAG: Unknown protein [uncultured Sulfurovum sp.]
MKKVSFVVEKLYQQNILFDKNQTKIFARDNAFAKYHIMYNVFRKNGYEIATCDINTIDDSDIVIYNDLPKKMPKQNNISKSYLIMNESPLVRPDNFDKSKHKYFNKIFTWNDDLVDNKKYFKFNYSFIIPKEIPKKFHKQNLCCLIVGNKDSNHSNELYSERKKLIRWFEINYPKNFALYGVGWNEYRFKGIKPIRAFNRIPIANKIMFKYFGEYYPSYRGKIKNKFETMQDYKFAICYENIKNISGYITEKILDAMFAGCIPIYLGANNITEHIPQNSFIDRRNFSSNEDIYTYIKNMNEKSYMEYLENIETFLNSEKGYKFSAKSNAEVFLNVI